MARIIVVLSAELVNRGSLNTVQQLATGATAGKRRNNKSAGSRKSRLKEPEECVEIDTALQRKLLTTVILPGGVVAIETCCAVKQGRKDGSVKRGVE